jgi:protein-tyrosine phosphatase
MSQILPGLFLGNILNVNRLQWLDQKNIQTIICVASKDDARIKDKIWKAKTVYQFEIMDNGEQILDFEPIIELIEESLKHGAVLVNCLVGISRSPSFVMAYLMKTQKKSLHDAYMIVKRARPKIGPNDSFIAQLIEYEKRINQPVV